MSAEQILTLIGIVLGSSGLWTLITKLIETKSKKKKSIEAICVGLAYDRCKFVAESYIKRGWITTSEYADYIKYLYEPYHNAGGDGTIDRLKAQIDKLPIGQEEGDDRQ